MSKFDVQEVIFKIKNEELQQELKDSLDIILHKIKFIEKNEVFICDENFAFNEAYVDLIERSGGRVNKDIQSAEKIICLSNHYDVASWITHIIQNIKHEWKAYHINQIYIVDIHKYKLTEPHEAIALVEDIAEMLYPGLFIFGGEGSRWIQFETYRS